MGIGSKIRKLLPGSWQSAARQVYYRVRTPFYLGDKYICPVCRTRLKKFRPITGSRHENLQCPRCGSLERHRLLWLYLNQRTPFFKNQLKVLEFAPLDYLQRQFRRLPNVEYISTDIDSSLAMVTMDITDLKFPDNNFDCILCYHVLEHVVDDKKALAELFRVLKSGGWGLLQVPVDYSRDTSLEDPTVISAEKRERIYGQHDHVRIYGRDYPQRLAQAGFLVTPDEFVKSLGPEKMECFCLAADEVLYVCRKP